MTLGQPVTLRGELESGKARCGPGKSFGAFFGAPALMEWPQTAVQNVTPWPLLTSVGETVSSDAECF